MWIIGPEAESTSYRWGLHHGASTISESHIDYSLLKLELTPKTRNPKFNIDNHVDHDITSILIFVPHINMLVTPDQLIIDINPQIESNNDACGYFTPILSIITLILRVDY